MIGISGIGLLALLLLEEIAMKTHTDTTFGLDEKKAIIGDPDVAEVQP